MKKNTYILCLIAFFLSFAISVGAHGGRTDSNGGHNSSSGYHYHHGYPAHEHYDIDGDGKKDCPYDFDDKTDHSSKDDVNIDSKDEAENIGFGSILVSVMLNASTFFISIGYSVALAGPLMYWASEKMNIRIGCFPLLILSYVITYLLFSLIASLVMYFNP